MNASNKIQVIQTLDGSSSLYNEKLNETYHSRHGAVTESEYVFIKMGLEFLGLKSDLKVLEVGMGTGLNVLLSAIWSLEYNTNIDFYTTEPFPVEPELIPKLNYSEQINHKNAEQYLNQIHSCDWDTSISLNSYFKFNKTQLKAQKLATDQKFDLIFYDAFGPHAQPELWELDIFEHLAKLCKPGSVLVTYCAQGQFKRNLKKVGFQVERLPGPPGKREMTRGVFELKTDSSAALSASNG